MSSQRTLKRISYSNGESAIKRNWTEEEDGQLKRLVEAYGARKWTLIAAKLSSRSGKQCRERWHNHLDHDVKKGAWTEAEDRIMLSMQRHYGNNWVKIGKLLPGNCEYEATSILHLPHL